MADPNAAVSAFVGGVVADRVHAEWQRRYQLTVPAHYGTSCAELEIVPAGGRPLTLQTRYPLFAEELLPAGTLYCDLQAGRERFDWSTYKYLPTYGHVRTNYGLPRNLTTLGSYTRVDTLQTATLGLVINIAGAAMFSAEGTDPSLAVRATLQLFLDQFQLPGEAAIATESGLD